MPKVLGVLGLVALIGFALAIAVSQPTMQHGIDTLDAYAQRPYSAMDVVAQGKTLYLEQDEGQSGFINGILVVIVVVGLPVGFIAFLKVRTEHLRQARLSKKANKKGSGGRGQARIIGDTRMPIGELGNTRRVGRVHELPDGMGDEYGI